MWPILANGEQWGVREHYRHTEEHKSTRLLYCSSFLHQKHENEKGTEGAGGTARASLFILLWKLLYNQGQISSSTLFLKSIFETLLHDSFDWHQGMAWQVLAGHRTESDWPDCVHLCMNKDPICKTNQKKASSLVLVMLTEDGSFCLWS